MNKKLKKAIEFRVAGDLVYSEKLFKQLLQSYPENARMYYHYAWLHDNMELEKEATIKYEKAIEFGLKGEELAGCYLGLGSTYRVIGEYGKSEKLLTHAIEVFPKNNEFKVFLSMTKYSLKKYDEAMGLALEVIAKTSSDKGVKEYEKAIIYYSTQLDKIFE